MAETDAQAVYFTRDYAPWSAALEQRITLNSGMPPSAVMADSF